MKPIRSEVYKNVNFFSNYVELFRKILKHYRLHGIKSLQKTTRYHLLHLIVPIYSRPQKAPYLFVHIPKTAGTSFRMALEELFGWHMVLRDYGPKKGRSSALISERLPKSSIGQIRETLKSFRLICGHVHLTKYLMLSGLAKTITFLREPLQRSYSNYLHASRIEGFQGSLNSYLQSQSNIQSRILGGLPLEALGFVGISERYSESLQLLQLQFPELKLTELRENFNEEKEEEYYRFSAEEEELLRQHNQNDLILYERALRLFEERLEAARIRTPYHRGGLQNIQKNLVQGWLSADDIAPVVLAKLDGRVIASTRAYEFRPGLACWGIEREGFVGFSLRSNEIDLQKCTVQLDDPTQRILLPL